MNLDLADVKPGLYNFLINGIMAVLFITFFKFVFAQWNIFGLSDLFSSI